MFAYCLNNPITNSDRTGRTSTNLFERVADCLLGLADQLVEYYYAETEKRFYVELTKLSVNTVVDSKIQDLAIDAIFDQCGIISKGDSVFANIFSKIELLLNEENLINGVSTGVPILSFVFSTISDFCNYGDDPVTLAHAIGLSAADVIIGTVFTSVFVATVPFSWAPLAATGICFVGSIFIGGIKDVIYESRKD